MKGVLIASFNRPANTRILLEKSLKSGSENIFIHIDGQPMGAKNQGVVESYQILFQNYANDSRVNFWIRDENNGAAGAITDAISWAFQFVEELLILEDDLEVNAELFSLTWKILEQFRGDPKYSSFSAFNPFRSSNNGNLLFASHISQTWGWATWKSNWEQFVDARMSWGSGNQYRELIDNTPFLNATEKKFWKLRIDEIQSFPRHIWDFQWLIFNLVNCRFALYPSQSLSGNNGFNRSATLRVRRRKLYMPKLENVYKSDVDKPFFLDVKLIDSEILGRYYRVNFLWPLNENARKYLRKGFIKLKFIRI